MAIFNWQVGSGAFNVASNWTVGGSTAGTPPGSADTADISSGMNGTVSGTGTVATLNVGPSGSYTFTGPISAGNININDASTIATGGTLTLTSGFAGIANTNGATGSLTITSGGALDSTIAPETSSYVLGVGGGSSVTGTNGTLTLQGLNAVVNTGGNAAAVGLSGTGTLNVLAGATASFGTSDPSQIVSLSVARQGQGSVTVDGAGSNLQLAGVMSAGRATGSFGSLTVSDGAGLTETAVGSGNVNGFGSSGTLSSTGAFLAGGTGLLTVESGGTANFADAVDFGLNGSAGVALISDGTVNINNILRLGAGTTDPNGQGLMTINDGGVVHITAAADTSSNYVQIGGTANTAGKMTVDGTNSLLDVGANALGLGNGGTGTMVISNGGQVRSSSANSSVLTAFSAANNAGSTANLTITGAGSSETASGYAYFGRGGNATVTIQYGGSFTGGSAATGTGTGANAAFGVAIGDGTPTFNASGVANTTLNFGGTGTANVLNDGTLTSLGTLLVGYRGSTGTLLDGADSTVTASGQINIGGGTDRAGGTGVVVVAYDSTLQGGGQHTAGTAGIVIGSASGTAGLVGVFGAGSSISASGDRLTLGSTGNGALIVSGGGAVSSGASYSDTEAALAVGAAASGLGQILITGAGSTLTASGLAVLGGNNTGNGLTAGGAGLINVTDDGTLQTGAMAVFTNSTLEIDSTSQATIAGNVLSIGNITSAGTLTITGVSIANINVSGGLTDVYAPFASSFSLSGTDTTLRVHVTLGSNTVTGMQFGDTIDLAGTTNATLSGTTVTTSFGSLSLNTAPTGYSYALIGDGNGGQQVVLDPATLPTNAFTVASGGTTTTSSGAAYSGTATDLQFQYIYSGTADASITAGVPNAFIVGGPGNDTIQALAGNNVLDGGTGTNILIGATGADGGVDTFDVNPGSSSVNDTLVNFHAGDTAILFGFQAGTSTQAISPTGGTAPYQGVTLTSATAGTSSAVNATITFAGISQATEAADFTFTTAGGSTPYLQIHYV